jgi:hypothetical protein
VQMRERSLTGTNGMRMPAAQFRVSPFDLWLSALALSSGLAVGIVVSKGDGRLFALAVLGLIAVVAVVCWPETVLMLWFVVILADGRWLTYHQVGPLYITEPLLALLVLGLVVRFAARGQADVEESTRRRALRPLLMLVVVMWVPAVVGLFLRTSAFDYVTARDFVLILYSLFGLLAAAATDLGHSYRRWFAVALAGSTVALLIVITGHAGPEETTSTGAIRVAAHTFTIAFGIAPIVLIAAAREQLLRPLYAIIGSIPFLIGLVFVNHRSAWLAFIAASVILFVKQFSVPVVIGGLVILTCGLILVSLNGSRSSTLGEEIARAKTVTSSTDPNAHFRLRFWRAALVKSFESPVIGNGFDPYPANIVPRQSVGIDPFPAPHNSFVAIGYRIGIIPLVLLVGMLLFLIFCGFRASVKGVNPRDRATCSALTAIVVYAGVTSAFNVFLEAPYAGPLFWTAVGLLAYAVFDDPFRSRAGRRKGQPTGPISRFVRPRCVG